MRLRPKAPQAPAANAFLVYSEPRERAWWMQMSLPPLREAITWDGRNDICHRTRNRLQGLLPQI